MKILLLLAALSAFASGCSADATKDKPITPLLLTGTNSAVRLARQMVVRDAKAFEALWQEHVRNNPMKPETPYVDFKLYDVVAVFAGSKPTGGYSVEIAQPVVKGKSATIAETIYKPGPGMMVTQAFTYPYAMRAVRKLPLKVEFKVETKAK